MNSFDPIKHQYFINKRPVVNVTAVLRDLIPGWLASDWYLERGQAVHAAAAFIARGKSFTFDPVISGQVAALRKFFKEVKPVVIECEMPVYSEHHQYGGTLDLLVDGRQNIIADFKSALTPSVPYQLAAYALAQNEMGLPIVSRGYGVEIRENGTYKMSEIYELRKYQQDWLSLLGTFNIRRKCGIKQQEEIDGN